MKIESISIAKIKPYSKNNRKHSDLQIERIGNSIKQFGFNQPLVVDENFEILVGHGRLLAAQKLGLTECPTVILSGLSAKDKRAYRILDNKLQNDSDWDWENLEAEIKAIEAEGFDLEGWDLNSLLISSDIEPIKEISGDIAEGIELCTCEICGHEHARKA